MVIRNNFAYISIKAYRLICCPLKHVVGTHYNRLAKAILMSTHNLCFYGELTKMKLDSKYNLLNTPLQITEVKKIQ